MITGISDLSKGVKATLGVLLVIAATSFGYFAVDKFINYARSDLQRELDQVTKSYADYRRETEAASRQAQTAAIDANAAYRKREKDLIDEAATVAMEFEAARGRWRAGTDELERRLRLAEQKLGRALSRVAANANRGTGGDPGTASVSDAGSTGAGGTVAAELVYERAARGIREILARHYGPIGDVADERNRQLAICYRVVATGAAPIRRDASGVAPAPSPSLQLQEP